MLQFMYAGPRIYQGQSTVLLGDSVHTVKPYFGLGVNSAWEDVFALDKALDTTADNVPFAIRRFSDERAKEAKHMVEISHRLDGGFLSFVLPLLVDNFLSAKLPQIFSVNTLSALQNENLSFAEIRR